MKAFILAGGKGTRLAPYTTILPKPMLPLGDKPILEIIIRQLAFYGFTDIIISIGYLGEWIKLYFQNGKKLPPGINLTYVSEDKPLGTAGPIALATGLTGSLLVMNGDVLTNLNFAQFHEFHRHQKHDLTIATYEKKIKIDVGIIEVDEEARVRDYIEKPTYTFNDSMGVYVIEPDIVKLIAPYEHLDFPALVKTAIARGRKVYNFSSQSAYFWIDMGSYGDYNKALEEFEKRKSEFSPWL